PAEAPPPLKNTGSWSVGPGGAARPARAMRPRLPLCARASYKARSLTRGSSGAGPSMAKTVYVLNGPNLNLLRTREPKTYGRATLKDVETPARAAAARHQLALEFRQSNHEGEIVDAIHEAHARKAAGIVINAGAYTHTSVAIRDAVAAVAVPV